MRSLRDLPGVRAIADPVEQQHRIELRGGPAKIDRRHARGRVDVLPFGQHAAAARVGDGQCSIRAALIDEEIDVALVETQKPSQKRQAIIGLQQIGPRPLDDIERRLEVPFGLGRVLRGDRGSAKTLVHGPLHRRFVFGQAQRLVKKARGVCQAALSECDLSSVCGIKVGPVTAKPPARPRSLPQPASIRPAERARSRYSRPTAPPHRSGRPLSRPSTARCKYMTPFATSPLNEVRIAKLAERPLVEHARPPRVFVRGDRTALRIDGARHVAKPVVTDTRIAEGN